MGIFDEKKQEEEKPQDYVIEDQDLLQTFADPEEEEEKRREQSEKRVKTGDDLSIIMYGEGYGFEAEKLAKEFSDVPSEEKKNGAWASIKSAIGSGANTALRQLTRVGRGSLAMITYSTKNTIDTMNKTGEHVDDVAKEKEGWKNIVEGNIGAEVKREFSDLFKQMGTGFNYIKKGFLLENEQRGDQIVDIGSGKDFRDSVFGPERSKAFEDYFNMSDEEAHLTLRDLLRKIPGVAAFDDWTTPTPEMKAGNARLRAERNKLMGLPADYEFTDDPSGPYSAVEGSKVAVKAYKNVPTLTDIGIETLGDPITYTTKGISAAISGGLELLTKGSLFGLAKVSPRAAATVERGATVIAENAKKAAGVIDRKYGVTSEYAKVLKNKDEAISIVEDVKEAAVFSKSGAQKMVTDLNKMLTKPGKVPGEFATLGEEIKGLGREIFSSPGALKRGALRSISKKLSEVVGHTPENAVLRYMVGIDARTEATEKIGKALIDAGDNSAAVLPKQFAEATKSAIDSLLKGTATQEEIAKIQDKLNKTVELSGIVKESAGFKYARDLNGIFEEMKQSVTTGGREIARDRRALRLNEMEKRFGVINETIKTAKADTVELSKAMQGEIRQTKLTAIKEFNSNLNLRNAAISREENDIITGLKKQAEDRINALKQEPKITADYFKKKVEERITTLKQEPKILGDRAKKVMDLRQRDKEVFKLKREFDAEKALAFKKRDREIFGIKRELDKKIQEVKQYSLSQSEVARKTLNKEMMDKVEKETAGIMSKFGNRTSDVLSGLPSEKNLFRMKLSAKKKVDQMFEQEVKFFSKQTAKAKFLNVYNGMLEDTYQVHNKIFENAIADLPDSWKGFARRWRSEMDMLATEEIQRGRMDSVMPNYFARVLAKKPEGGLIKFDPEDFLKDFFKSKGTGVSRFSTDRKFEDFNSFKKYIEEHGGKVEEDPLAVLFDRYQKSKADQALHQIKQVIPENLKTGEAGRKMGLYLDYIFNGGAKDDNTVRKLLRGASNTYQFYTKAMLTVLSPAYYVKDTMGYPFLVAQRSSMRHGLDAGSFVEAAGLKLGIQDDVVNKLGEKMSAKEFMDGLVKHGLTGSSFTRGSIPETLDQVLNRYSKADPRHWITKALHAGQTKEDIGRTFAALTFWKEGISVKEAARKAKVAMYDFNDFNYIDRALSGMFAFYGFSRKNLVGTLKGMVENPQQFALMSRVVDDFSYGNKPSDDDLNLMSSWDKDKLQIFTDFVQGKHEAWNAGFLPFEDFYQNAGHLLKGDLDGWMGKVESRFSPGTKLVLKRLAEKLDLPWYSIKEQYQFLPREYNTLNDKQIETMNQVSQFLGYGTIQRRDRIVKEHGVPFHEKGIFVPPKMMDLMTSLPTARIQKEFLGLIQLYQQKTKGDTADATGVDMVKHGQIDTAQKLLQYITGIKKTEFDFKDLKERRAKANYKKLIDKGKSLKLIQSFDVIPPEYKDKYESGIDKADELRDAGQ